MKIYLLFYLVSFVNAYFKYHTDNFIPYCSFIFDNSMSSLILFNNPILIFIFSYVLDAIHNWSLQMSLCLINYPLGILCLLWFLFFIFINVEINIFFLSSLKMIFSNISGFVSSVRVFSLKLNTINLSD